MDEYNQGWDPDVKKYFRKIMNSFVYFFTWLFTFAIAGLYFNLGIVDGGIRWYNILFYVLLIGSFAYLLFFLYRYWKDYL